MGLGDVWWVSIVDSLLCAAVGAQDDPQRFLRLVDSLEHSPPVPDREILIRRNLARARALLLRGRLPMPKRRRDAALASPSQPISYPTTQMPS
jgi:hypothetical protein